MIHIVGQKVKQLSYNSCLFCAMNPAFRCQSCCQIDLSFISRIKCKISFLNSFTYYHNTHKIVYFYVCSYNSQNSRIVFSYKKVSFSLCICIYFYIYMSVYIYSQRKSFLFCRYIIKTHTVIIISM